MGKSAAAVLEAVVELPGVSRAELAAKPGKKSDSLSRSLKKLVDRGLIERCGKGRYRPTDDWQQKLERELTLTGEKRAERLDEQEYQREREAYRLSLAEKEEKIARGGPAAHAGLDVTALGGATPAQASDTHRTKGLSSRRREL